MQLRWVIGSGLILAAFAVIAVVTYFANQELYLTVDELVTDAQLYPRQPEARSPGALSATNASARDRQPRRLQVRGRVDHATVTRGPAPLEVRFDLVGQIGRLPVRYVGVIPDTFEQAEAVTVAGRVDVRSDTFQADELLVQCPSKYQAAPAGGVADRAIRGGVAPTAEGDG